MNLLPLFINSWRMLIRETSLERERRKRRLIIHVIRTVIKTVSLQISFVRLNNEDLIGIGSSTINNNIIRKIIDKF